MVFVVLYRLWVCPAKSLARSLSLSLTNTHARAHSHTTSIIGQEGYYLGLHDWILKQVVSHLSYFLFLHLHQFTRIHSLLGRCEYGLTRDAIFQIFTGNKECWTLPSRYQARSWCCTVSPMAGIIGNIYESIRACFRCQSSWASSALIKPSSNISKSKRMAAITTNAHARSEQTFCNHPPTSPRARGRAQGKNLKPRVLLMLLLWLVMNSAPHDRQASAKLRQN